MAFQFDSWWVSLLVYHAYGSERYAPQMRPPPSFFHESRSTCLRTYLPLLLCLERFYHPARFVNLFVPDGQLRSFTLLFLFLSYTHDINTSPPFLPPPPLILPPFPEPAFRRPNPFLLSVLRLYCCLFSCVVLRAGTCLSPPVQLCWPPHSSSLLHRHYFKSVLLV